MLQSRGGMLSIQSVKECLIPHHESECIKKNEEKSIGTAVDYDYFYDVVTKAMIRL